MSLMEDWMIFIAEKLSFDPEHFSNLFKYHNDPEQIKMIFSFHRNGKIASDRLISFFKNTEFNGYATPIISGEIGKHEISIVFKRFKYDIVNFLSVNNESIIAKKITRMDIIFNEDYKYVARQRNRTDIFHPEFFDAMSDIFRGTYDCDFMIGSALREAIYQLTTDCDVTRYLFSPLTRFPNSFENGYRFWLARGVYCFYDDHVEITAEKRREI